ncbi:hypothetical protein B0G81_6806 [Paraburkholderia sp. BL6665CI2N2]|uniref:hypothetical protein n=1 Tax=Paraburkholderia sp. BL6665CI2N2 TaxID=1938806 RepID=UPI0010656810|nr:hypothetical protein [Paraburkholderia sp. BL6665CI2N2]TDY26296.1 hypothetical protein B0G81_6806 [Paraburkholderia sp. BL6665CI2N2]
MFKRLMQRFVLLEGEGASDAPTGGAPAAAPTPAPSPAPAPAPTPSPAAAPTPPGNLVADAVAPAADATAAAAAAKADGAEKAGEADAAGKEGGKETGEKTPVEYTDFKLPEGVEVDEAKLNDFKAKASEAGLTQEQAQQLVDLHANTLKSATDASTQLWYDTQKQWQEAVMKDPEIGGKNFEPMKAVVANAIDVIGGEDAAKIRQAFEYTGAGNNPEVIRFLYRLGQTIGEGGSVASGAPAASGQPKSAAEKLYPSQSQTNQ